MLWLLLASACVWKHLIYAVMSADDSSALHTTHLEFRFVCEVLGIHAHSVKMSYHSNIAHKRISRVLHHTHDYLQFGRHMVPLVAGAPCKQPQGSISD
jgi:hypothetical protein